MVMKNRHEEDWAGCVNTYMSPEKEAEYIRSQKAAQERANKRNEWKTTLPKSDLFYVTCAASGVIVQANHSRVSFYGFKPEAAICSEYQESCNGKPVASWRVPDEVAHEVLPLIAQGLKAFVPLTSGTPRPVKRNR
jgi:hypothetical protein